VAGAPTTATFAVDASKQVRFEVETKAASLAAVKRLGGVASGSARVKVAGTFKDGALDARVTAHADDVRAPGGVSVGGADLEARVHGPAASPSVDAKVRGSGVRAGKYAWDAVEVKANGPALSGLRVEAQLAGRNEAIAAAGAVDVRDKAVRGVTLSVKRKDGEIAGKIDRIGAGPGGVLIDGLALHGDGVGDLEGGLTVVGGEIVGKLRGREVNLERVAAMADVPLGVKGLANVDVDLRSDRPGYRQGHVDVELVNGELAHQIDGIGALFSATFDGDKVRVDGLVRVVAHAGPKEREGERCDGAMASVRVSNGQGVLGGPLLDPATWRRASGRVEIAADDWNLRCLARLAPTQLVLSELRGKLTTRATVERAPGARLPSVREVLVRTRGLVVAGLEGRDDRPEWDSREMDVELKGSFDAPSGVLQVRAAVSDGQPIASVSGRFPLDLAALLDHPEARARLLEQMPLDLRLRIPRRAVQAFDSLPSFVAKALPPLGGEVELRADVTGTLAAPRATAALKGWGLAHALPLPDDARARARAGSAAARPAVESAWALPLDVNADVTWEGTKLVAALHVKRNEQEVVRGGADLALSLADVVAGKPIAPSGDVRAEILRLPVGDIPFLADRDIRGHLEGSLAILGLGKEPTLELGLRVPDLSIGRDLVYDKAEVTARFGPKKDAAGVARNHAEVRAEISSKAGGRFLAQAFNDVVWHGGFVPDVDPTRPADVTVKAQRFRVAALGPFVSALLSHVDGVLDGAAALSWPRLDHPDQAKASVRMQLSGGVFHVPQLGQEFHDAEVIMSGGPRGLIKLDTIRADGQKGRITGSGSLQLDGLAFRKAEASFTIKPGEELPVTLEGVPFGDARGRVKIVAEQQKNLLAVVVDIPSLHVALPNSSARGVQTLEGNPDIYILQDGPRLRTAATREQNNLSLTFNIGDVTVQGSLLDVGLSGVPNAPIKVEILDKTRITGDIQLSRGRVEVLHKQFEIEQGVVHMRPEDPGNPYVNVTARWDSPEGPIYIDYTGVLLPIAPEKLKYRSPTIPEDRIMATLLFGGMEQSTLGASSAPGQSALPGQALAAQLIAQQLSTQIVGNISTSVAANDDGTFRPGLVYKSGDKVIELSTYGATGQGSGAATKGQHTMITVDWRFWRNWMLRGRVDVAPDQTTSGVDVLWQYRY
jgi:translocation and assembly module TamB